MAGSAASSVRSPEAALREKSRRAERTCVPQETSSAPVAASGGTHDATSPAPQVTMPASPMLRTQASRVWAMVA